VAVPVAVLAILAGVLLWEAYSLNRSLLWVDHTDQVTSSSRRLLKLTLDEQTGVRGYLLTGDEVFLEPYRAARPAFDSEYEAIYRLVAENPPQQVRLERIHDLYEQWQRYAERRIELRRAGGAYAGTEALLEGERQMDGLRNQVAEFQSVEERLRDERNRTAQGRWRLITASCIVLVLGVGAVIAILTRLQIKTLAASFQESLDSATDRAAALAASEERWATTLASIGDGVMATDAKGRITFINPVADSLLQSARSECLGKPVDEVFKLEDEDTGAAMEGPVAKAIRLNRVIELGNHAVLVSRKGSRTPVADSAAPIRDAAGNLTGVVLVFRDVTERRDRERERAQALLREQVARQMAEDTASHLRKIESVTEAMLAHLPLDQMLQQLLHKTAEALQADMALILLLNEKTRMLEVRAGIGLDEEIRQSVHVPLGHGIAGAIAKTGQLRIVENLGQADVASPYLHERSASLMGAPLIVEDRVIGVIHVDSARPRKFTDTEASLLQVVADRIALAIERKQAEEALQENRRQLQEIIDGATETLVFVKDVDGRFITVNSRFEQLLGIARDDVRGKTDYDIVTKERADYYRAHDRLVLTTGQPMQVEEVALLADGKEHIFLANKFPLADAGGKPYAVCAISVDITERKRAEIESHAREQRLRLAADAAQLGIFEWTVPTDTAVWENQRMYEIFGIPETTDPVNRDRFVRETVHPEDLPRFTQELEESMQPGAVFRGAYRIRRVNDGQWRWIQYFAKFELTPDGKPLRLLGVLADITERKRAEERISHLASFPELNPIVIFETDLEGKITYANPAAQKQFPDLVQRAADHPLLAEWAAVLDRFRTGAEQVVVRDVETDGWVLQQTICYTPELRLVRAYLTDITERRRVEKEREITVEFLRLVNDATATRDMIRAAVTFFQEQSGCEAVGLRVRDGDDYPYYEVRGFPREFVLAENSLCTRNEAGEIVRDDDGYPVHECMCGNVICGRLDPAKPFFTGRGSFWTNSTAELLATTTEADRQSRTRNRCNGEGYESVALIPLHLGEERLGLVQLNDRRKGKFSAEIIALYERLADYLAVALAKFRAQEALRDSEAQFRTLANAIPQLCWMANADGWIFWYNERWYEYTGATPQQMEGWGWQSVHNPETLPAVLERWKVSIAGGQPFDMVFPLRGADGVFRPFLTRIVPVKNTDGEVVRWFGTNTDVTELRNAQEALRASEERWAITLQSIGDAVISTCAQGKIVFMNEVAQKLTGWPLAEVKGKDLETVFNIVQEVTRIKPESPVSKVIRLGKVVGLANHTVLISRSGKEVPIEDSGAPIRNREGRIEGVVMVFHDVSEQRKMEQAVRNSERLAVTGRLAASIAHEIHNPLDTVGNLLFLVRQNTQEAATRQHASMASDELARIAQMTHQMLTFQRESAKPVPVKIKEVFENVLALYQRKVESAAIRIEREIDVPEPLLARPGELRQVLANLLGNAIEVVDHGQGRIWLRAYMSRHWRSGRCGVRVVIADNGRGIPAEVREKIFEPFFTTKGESGTGLGLWITSDIVTKYGGAMRLRSSTQPGRSGTCFSVFFPTPSTG
jgi:PAS domain S-box-containing protein